MLDDTHGKPMLVAHVTRRHLRDRAREEDDEDDLVA